MKPATKHYVIEFTYTDNNQLYQTDAMLTEEQSSRVDRFLEKLEEAGEIEMSSVYEYSEPTPISFEELEQHFTEENDSIVAMCEAAEVKF